MLSSELDMLRNSWRKMLPTSEKLQIKEKHRYYLAVLNLQPIILSAEML